MIDFFSIINEVSAYLQANIKIAIAIALLLLIIIYKKPKLFMLIFVISVVLSGALYLISNIASTGTSYKGKLIKQRQLPP